MGGLYGYIVSIKELLSCDESTIKVNIGGVFHDVHKLKAYRKFIIPDFQREIRWTHDNVAELIEDVSRKEKHLGNIILTQQVDNYEIIDGQQRITTFLMLLAFIRKKHGTSIDVISSCDLLIESFKKFQDVLNSNFSDDKFNSQDVVDSDELQQREKYKQLWNYIASNSPLSIKQNAQKFLDNLMGCTVNIVLNQTPDTSIGISYFIDVNLKGLRLDDEDVFKGYLFKNDSSDDIRQKWYQFKKTIVQIQQSRVDYPLLKLIEHYLYCDLFEDGKFKSLVFKADLRLAEAFEIKDDRIEPFRKDTHIIEVINDKSYFIKAFAQLNCAIEIMLKFVSCDGLSNEVKALLSVTSGGTVDNCEMAVIHNLISKILKDKTVLPKALVMKYILNVLLNDTRTKDDIRKIYGVYLLSVLFVVFQNKKSIDAFTSVLQASMPNWYGEVIKKVEGKFDNSNPTQSKLISAVKHISDEDEEDYHFRCKSLATIYNFFKVTNGKVTCKPISETKKFLTDSTSFSTEHFIISESDTVKVKLSDGTKQDYSLLDSAKKMRLGFFNFIFIPEDTNNQLLSNNWLPEKLSLLKDVEIKCDYSKMIVEAVSNLSQGMENALNGNDVNNLDSFFARQFSELYVEYARSVLSAIVDRLTNSSNG